MNNLIQRLRGSAEPVGKLMLEAAEALQAAQTRIAELTETLRTVVEISNSQRSREFADVKKTLTKARELLTSGAAVAAAPAPAPAASAAPRQVQPPPSGIAPAAQPEEPKDRDEEIVSGMYKEIQNLLRHSA